jgi:pimeloyl-ACP methyl ester carboxylesterase
MELYFKEFGPQDAPTIVFLHGGGGASWMWQPQIDRLADYHCLAPDLPGHGKSAALAPWSIPSAAELITDLIRRQAPGGKAHVIGLSLGAQVAVSLLSSAPEVVDHTILSSALLRPLPMAWMYSPDVIKFLFSISVAPFKNNRWWAHVNMKYSAAISEEFFPQYFEDYQSLTAEQFAHVISENQKFRLPPNLDRVTSPVLVVIGHEEYKAMRLSACDLAAAIPGARGVEVTRLEKLSVAAEHNWSMTAPELFTNMVCAWISGSPLPEELQPLSGCQSA